MVSAVVGAAAPPTPITISRTVAGLHEDWTVPYTFAGRTIFAVQCHGSAQDTPAWTVPPPHMKAVEQEMDPLFPQTCSGDFTSIHSALPGPQTNLLLSTVARLPQCALITQAWEPGCCPPTMCMRPGPGLGARHCAGHSGTSQG